MENIKAAVKRFNELLMDGEEVLEIIEDKNFKDEEGLIAIIDVHEDFDVFLAIDGLNQRLNDDYHLEAYNSFIIHVYEG